MKKIKRILLSMWIFFNGGITKIYGGMFEDFRDVNILYGIQRPRVSLEEKKNILLMVVKRINFTMLSVMTFIISIMAFLIAFNRKASNRKKVIVFLIIVVWGIIATVSLYSLISSDSFNEALECIIDNHYRDEYVSEKDFADAIINEIHPNTVISFLIIGFTFLISAFVLLSEKISKTTKKIIIIIIFSVLIFAIHCNIIFFKMSRI